ncbi:GSCOCG00003514001-RA-CDS, partial [Cotesia congregata]
MADGNTEDDTLNEVVSLEEEVMMRYRRDRIQLLKMLNTAYEQLLQEKMTNYNYRNSKNITRPNVLEAIKDHIFTQGYQAVVLELPIFLDMSEYVWNIRFCYNAINFFGVTKDTSHGW